MSEYIKPDGRPYAPRMDRVLRWQQIDSMMRSGFPELVGISGVGVVLWRDEPSPWGWMWPIIWGVLNLTYWCLLRYKR